MLVARTYLVSPLVTKPPNDPEYNAVRTFELLELLHKLRFHMRTAQAMLTTLQSLRHVASGDELWTDVTVPTEAVSAMEQLLYPLLGLVALQLPADTHDSSRPDLFGQAYRLLFDRTFHAIIDGQDDAALLLFPIVVSVAARQRRNRPQLAAVDRRPVRVDLSRSRCSLSLTRLGGKSSRDGVDACATPPIVVPPRALSSLDCGSAHFFFEFAFIRQCQPNGLPHLTGAGATHL